MSDDFYHRLIILGSGPAGYTAAIYAARAGLSPVIITGMAQGGQLMTTTDVDNWPADVAGVQGPALMARFEEHARRFETQIILDEVLETNLRDKPFTLKGSNHNYRCDALIIATGANAQYLGLPSEAAYQGKGVSACATCDGFFFKNQPVAVIGGGNTAVEEALYLSHLASHVTVVHRRDRFRAEKILSDKLFQREREGKVSIVWNATLDEVQGNGKEVTGIRLNMLKEKCLREIPLSGVFIAIGHKPNTAIFEGQLAMTQGGYIKTHGGHAGMATATSVTGVFASGDVQDAIYRQAVTSAASGCMAALDAKHYLEDI